MITMDQMKMGLATYCDREIADRIPGLRKWVVSLVASSMIMKSEGLISQYKDILTNTGYLHEDGMIDADMLFADLSRIAREKGEVVENIHGIGDVRFSEKDVEALRRYTGA